MDNRQVCWPACEIEAYFFSEIEVRGQNAKKKKKKKTRFNTITGIADTSLITSAVITGGISTSTAFTSGIGLLVGAAFSRAGGLLSLATVIRRKSFKIFAVKQKKYDAIKDGDISPTEFHKALQEVEKYRKLKADIRD